MVVGVVRVMRPPFAVRTAILDRLAVMLNRRERLVIAMQYLAPLAVARRLAKTHRVRLDAAPPHQEKVAIFALDAGANLHLLKAFGRFDQRTNLFHRSLECGRLAPSDVEDGVLEDHSAARIRSA